MHLDKIIKTFEEEGRWEKSAVNIYVTKLTDLKTGVVVLLTASSKYYHADLYVEEESIVIGEEEPYFHEKVAELRDKLESEEQRKRLKAEADKKVKVCTTIDQLYGD